MNALRLFGPKLDTPELLEQFYAAVMPAMDRDGFRLYFTAAKMTGFNPYEVFSYEDNRGMFEEADGHIVIGMITKSIGLVGRGRNYLIG